MQDARHLPPAQSHLRFECALRVRVPHGKQPLPRVLIINALTTISLHDFRLRSSVTDPTLAPMSTREGRFLIVEDEVLVATSLVRLILRRQLGACVVARNADEATRLLSDGSSFTALVIDIGLPDGAGLDVLAKARTEAHALTPALVLTGSNSREHINRGLQLDAKYIVKPVEADRLAVFLEDAISLARRLEIAARSRHLSGTLAEIVTRSALGETRETIAEARGTSVKTVENQAAKAAERAGQPSFRTLVGDVLRDVARSR
jgi:DNA-binding response OmpR family regulator